MTQAAFTPYHHHNYAKPKLRVLYPTGNVRRTHTTTCRSNAGRKTETYAFKNPSDVKAMQENLLYHSSTQRHYRLRNYLFFSLGLNLGFRASDLCSLRWCNIYHPHSSDFNSADWNVVTEMKTGKTRQVVLNASAQNAITFYVLESGIIPEALDPTSYVFASRKGNSHINPDAMRKIIKTAAAQCNIPFNVGTHSMRKTFGYNLYKASGKDIGLVQSILNHSSEKTTLRYIGVDKEQTRDAYSLLQDNIWVPGKPLITN